MQELPGPVEADTSIVHDVSSKYRTSQGTLKRQKNGLSDRSARFRIDGRPVERLSASTPEQRENGTLGSRVNSGHMRR
jgi:hypothetical protein